MHPRSPKWDSSIFIGRLINFLFVFCFEQHGAVVNVADLWKFTPLHEASAKGKFEICRLLLKVGYAINYFFHVGWYQFIKSFIGMF